ncbi:unnamed protein product [Linum tenue]|uniref:C2 domain-containing protein n=1 Tax=Linum tenue TaxID=586396 RepID=A0AAV0H1I5_9ROSI|nr:unnamed protein product [Linum tenue]
MSYKVGDFIGIRSKLQPGLLMDSPQSVVSPFKNAVTTEPEKHKTDYSVRSAVSSITKEEGTRKATNGHVEDNFIGMLEVYVHQARDIHNICIYHKQDVYAKVCLTSDPENTVSTNTINGGGRNPVFNQNLRINVKTVDCSLKCEIFMMSRVRNYLEDQLLGFALVPLSEVVMKNGKLEKEFSLSSTDLFHSPAGYVQLSLSYSGATPDVMAIPAADGIMRDAEVQESLECELDKLEFPDPNVANENQMMVSEYFGTPCTNLDDSETSESLVTCDAADSHTSTATCTANGVESFSAARVDSALATNKPDSPPSSVSTTNGVVSSPSNGVSSDNSKTQSEEHNSVCKEDKGIDAANGETDSSAGTPREEVTKPVVTMKMESEQGVVQQDIVDMYMKSMQQFTESLAKMKLPLDIDNSGPASSGSSNSEQQKTPSSTKTGSRVFYGSRAFF